MEWIENLAKAEQLLEQTGQIDITSHIDQDKLSQEHTTAFLLYLKKVFQNYINSFNAYRADPRFMIKIYHISNTAADFLIFRNSLKLIVAAKRPGFVSFSFQTLTAALVQSKGGTPPTGKTNTPSPSESGDLFQLELGSFNEPSWMFRGKKIQPEAVARYYLTEFIKGSVS